MRRIRCLLIAALAAGCASAPERPPSLPRPPAPPPAPEAGRAPTPEPPPASRRPPRPSWLEAQPFPKTLPIPVDGVVYTELQTSFDAPRSGGRRHRAIDIFAPRHAPVRSTVDGYVVRRRVLRLGGRTISIVGPAGYRHYYAHLEAWAGFDIGDYVRAGDVIGYVGNSGNASGGPTHLHYAIYAIGQSPIDPYDLLRRGPGSFE